MLPDWGPRPAGSTVARVGFAAAAGLVGSYAIAGFTPEFIAAPVTAVMAKNLPGVLITFAILTLGSLGQQLNLLASIGVIAVLLGGTAAVGIAVERRTDVPLAGGAVAGLLAWCLAVALTQAPLPAVGAGVGTGLVVFGGTLFGRLDRFDGTVSRSRRRLLGSLSGTVGVGIVGGLLAGRADPGPEPPTPDALADGASGTDSGAREQHSPTADTPTAAPGSARTTQAAASTATSAGTATTTPATTATPESVIDRLLNEAREKSLDVEYIEPLVSETFYEVDINAVNPAVEADGWELSVTGAVENEATYTYADLTGMPVDHRFVTLRCVGESLNGHKMDTALWTGVPVDHLLEQAVPTSDCACVMLRAADDYYEEFPLEALRGGLLAYGMNGESLPRPHGYPLRALVPGHWGEVNVKWLTEIELLEEEAEGYWEKRGWHGTGPVHTVAKLHDVARPDDGRIQVAGHAYAGTRGIDRVEVSIDGGDWATARLSDPLPGDDVWRQWVYTYDPPAGEHEVVVRAVDGTGTVQPEERTEAFPDGPTGWVSKTIKP